MALSFVGLNAAAADSTSLPAFVAGDIALVFAYRDGSNTSPSLPGAGWTDIAASGADTNSSRLGYRVLVSGDTTTGTWANATEIQVLVLRGQRALTPVGGNSASGEASSTQISYPAVTLTDVDGSSWVAGFAGHRTATDVNSKAVTGMTTRSGAVGTLGAHTVANVTNFSAGTYGEGTWQTATYGGTGSLNYTTTVNASSSWRSYGVEVRSTDEAATSVARISLEAGEVPDTRTEHRIVLRARKTNAAHTAKVRVSLYEGATERSDLDTGELTTSFTDYTLAIPDVDAASIGSYADLELRLQGYSSLGDAAVFEVAAAHLILPYSTSGESFGAVIFDSAVTILPSGIVLGSAATQTLVARISLESASTPELRENHHIIVRARKTNAAHSGELTVHLYEGATPRSILASTGELTDSFADYTIWIAEASANSIVSYDDLEVRLRGVAPTGDATVFEVAEVSLVLPATLTGGEQEGQVVFSSITAVSVGAFVVVYPGTAVFPRNLLSFKATGSIEVDWVGGDVFGAVQFPSTAGLQIAGAAPDGHTGLVLLASTASVAVSGVDTARIGRVLFTSTATVTIGGFAVQDVVAAVAIPAVATLTVAGVDSGEILPPGFLDLPFDDMPELLVAIAFPSTPLEPLQTYVSVSPYVRGITANRGRQFELDRVEAGQEDFILSNLDGRFNPENTASPYYPNLIPTKRVRWAMFWNEVTYDIFNGFLEGYPQEFPHYVDNIVRQHAVDAFMTLATAKLLPGSTVLTTNMNVTTEDRGGVIGAENVNLPMPQAVPFTIRIDDETMTVVQIYGPEHDQYELIPGLIGYRVARLSGNPIHTAGAVITTTVVSFGQEYTGQRIQNVLASVGLSPVDWAVDHGQSLLAPSEDLAGQTPLEHCLAVAEWEGGRFFSAKDGKATFLDRHYFFAHEKTARTTFGDGGGLGGTPYGSSGYGSGPHGGGGGDLELPYSEVTVTHDDEKIYNIIRITPASGNVKEVRDEQSIVDHFDRVLEKDWPLADDNEAQAAAEYLLYRYSRMQVRVPSITLVGRRNPDVMWPHLLGAEFGQRFRFIRRPEGDATIDKQLIVEGVEHTLTLDNLKTKLQLSLADSRIYWQLEVPGQSELNDTRLIY